MQVSNQMMNNTLTAYILKNRNATFAIQQQIASGVKVSKASDDPNAFDTIGRLKSNLSCINQYARNTVQLKNELYNMDGNLQKMSSLLQTVSEAIVRASNGTIPPSDRKSVGEEVNQLLEDMVDLANANPDGRYVFGGLRTDTPPYLVTRNAEGNITGVTYQGNTDVRQVEVGKNAYVAANIPGTDTSGSLAVLQTDSTDIIGNLIQLRDRLFAGENPVDPETFAVDAGADTLTVGKIYNTGALVQLASDGTLPGGLDPNQQYYAIRISATEIQLADSLANARAGIAVDITSAGTGTHNITQLSLEENTRDLEHITSLLGVVGARQQRVEVCEKILSQWETDLETTLDDTQSVDIAKAYTELSTRKLAYEAALQATSSVMGVSLLNYI